MNSGWRLANVLRAPGTALGFTATEWTELFAVARAEQMAGTLAHRLNGLALPPQVQRLVDDAIASAEQVRLAALWEAEMARRALAPLGMPVILLKGTAFAAAGLSPSVGRNIGDLDILVPRDRIEEAEVALLAAGWEWVKPDPYDDAYYRRWMHELPPLIHRERDRMIDVHHTILPLTARIRPDAGNLIAQSVTLENGLRILSPEHIVMHAAAHLIADGELAGGMRNLWDIDRLCREFTEQDTDFCLSLYEESAPHGLLPAVNRALRLAERLYGTPVMRYRAPIRVNLDPRASDRFFLDRMTARDGWGRSTRKLLQLAFYLRGHWLRMPPLMLARHVWTKYRKGYRPVG